MTRRGTSKGTPKADKLAQLIQAEAAKMHPAAVATIDSTVPEHQQILEAITQARDTWNNDGIELAYQMARGHTAGIWSKFKGHENEDDFWMDVLGLAPRTVDRMIAVGSLIDKLPEPDRPHAKVALAAIGLHKAEIVRPMILEAIDKAQKTDAPAVIHWREWTDKAASAAEPKLQEIVGQARGIRRVGSGTTAPNGRGNRAGGRQAEDPFLTYLANKMPTQELKDQLLETFSYGYRLANTDSTVAVLIALVQEMHLTWKQMVEAEAAPQTAAQAPDIIEIPPETPAVEPEAEGGGPIGEDIAGAAVDEMPDPDAVDDESEVELADEDADVSEELRGS